MLAVTASRGRTLLPDDAAAPGSSPVVVLSFLAWRNKFNGDPAIVGKKIAVRGFPLEVVGIAPSDFTGTIGVPLDFWAPITLAPQLSDGPSLFEQIRVTGRLRRGWSVRRTEEELSAWLRARTGRRMTGPRAWSYIRNRAAYHCNRQ